MEKQQPKTNETSQKMGVTVDEKSIGMWYLQINDTDDWMAHLAKTKKPDAFEIICRFRYKDHKSWYNLRFNGNIDKAIEKTREIATVLAKTSGGHLDELLVKDGDTDGFMLDIMSMPWANMKRAGNA